MTQRATQKETLTTADALRTAALKILEEEGPAAVSLRRVAAEVGITPMAIYHHFASREALLHDVCDAEFNRHAALLVANQRKTGGSIEARMTHNLESFLDFALQRPHVYDFVFSQPREGARRYPDDFKARRSPTANVLADLIAEGMRTGLFRKGDVWETTLMIAAYTQGLITLWRGGRFSLSEEEFRAFVLRSSRRLIDGFKNPKR
jgi:AcrR family transcriptional regulator